MWETIKARLVLQLKFATSEGAGGFSPLKKGKNIKAFRPSCRSSCRSFFLSFPRHRFHALTGEDCYSVLKACEGLVEDARSAGMSPAAAAAVVRVRVAMARTARLMPLLS